ncbi:carbohydrate ABC transporter permease [Microbacterium alcoholitolerans]|uniref:carbohydrate ABC transporter permease n=1 Tax=unclassified Microbacterium TaxID=2609290 RepID=UPI003D1789C2
MSTIVAEPSTRAVVAPGAPGPQRGLSRKSRRRAWGAVRGVLIALVTVAFGFPLVWMLIASFQPSIVITSPDSISKFQFTVENFVNVFAKQQFAFFAWNSFFIAASTTVLSLVIGVPAAYAIARWSMNRSSFVVLIARIVPGISLLVPWYYIFAQIGLVDSYAALILTHMFVGLPLVVWIMMNTFEALPAELEEAGQIDGLSQIGAFVRVAVPLAAPGIATATVLSMIFSWNNFLFALVLSGATTKTLPAAIFNFISYASIDWGGLMAAAVVITVPVMLISLFMQRYIVSGLTGGATKG